MKTRLMKTLMGSLLLAGALVALAMAFSTPGIAQAQSPAAPCGVETLRGPYIFATHGYNIVDGVAQPKAILEGIHFNGDGTLFSPFATVSINGTILHFSGGVGSYTVNADCTGTITFSNGPSFDIFVDSPGKQLWMIQTGPAAAPAVFQGRAIKVAH